LARRGQIPRPWVYLNLRCYVPVVVAIRPADPSILGLGVELSVVHAPPEHCARTKSFLQVTDRLAIDDPSGWSFPGICG